jgi:hypothetical protein
MAELTRSGDKFYIDGVEVPEAEWMAAYNRLEEERETEEEENEGGPPGPEPDEP